MFGSAKGEGVMSEESARVSGKVNGDGASFQRRVYSQEFKNQAADLVLKQGYSALQAARQLGISHKTLANWIRPQRKLKRDQMITEGLQHDDPAALRAHIADLQKQLRKTEMERDILKKFGQYAATQMNS
jgi:transposase